MTATKIDMSAVNGTDPGSSTNMDKQPLYRLFDGQYLDSHTDWHLHTVPHDGT